jgi:hypothetical protein
MGEALAWSFNAGSAGGSLDASGTLDAEAVTVAGVTVEPASNRALNIQLADVSKLAFLAVKSSLYGDKVKVKAAGAGAKEIVLTGPLVMFGGAIGLLGASLATLTVTNDDAAARADIEILIGSKLS